MEIDFDILSQSFLLVEAWEIVEPETLLSIRTPRSVSRGFKLFGSLPRNLTHIQIHDSKVDEYMYRILGIYFSMHDHVYFFWFLR